MSDFCFAVLSRTSDSFFAKSRNVGNVPRRETSAFHHDDFNSKQSKCDSNKKNG